MKSNSIYRLIFDNFLPKICDINSYCYIVLTSRKRVLYCLSSNDDLLAVYDFDGIVGEYKEILIDEINPYYSIKALNKPISLKQLKAKHDIPF